MTRYEWDEWKNRLNERKHGISFETAILVFDDPRVLSEVERVVGNEERWQSVGLVGNVLVLLVAHTSRVENEIDEVIRIISARKATPRERRKYEESL